MGRGGGLDKGGKCTKYTYDLILRLFDLGSGQVVVDLGRDLRNGAGMLDVTWFTESTFLSCGYDTCTRLWDTRYLLIYILSIFDCKEYVPLYVRVR